MGRRIRRPSTSCLKEALRPVSKDEVQDAIKGNLCRCGTYPHVIAAVVAASKERA